MIIFLTNFLDVVDDDIDIIEVSYIISLILEYIIKIYARMRVKLSYCM